MADGQIEVTPEALHQHAADVKSFMADLDGASSSAGDDFDIQAFGLIGMSWSWILKNWTDSASGFLKTTTSAGEHVSDQLTTMATNYTDTETGNAQSFAAIKNEDTAS
jgi:Excreted virulence factor EspC, type VII ESX diderm